MQYLLILETATDICSVCIADKKGRILVSESVKPRVHSEQMAMMVKNLLSENAIAMSQISAVCVSKGPGSYTGLRVGVSFAKGICYGSDIPLLAISTLKGLANQVSAKSTYAETKTLFCPMLDARRMEVYMAVFNQKGQLILPHQALVFTDGTLDYLLAHHKVCFFGDGMPKLKESLSKHPNALFEDHIRADAKSLITDAFNAFDEKRFEHLADFEPYYLKDFIAVNTAKKIPDILQKNR